MLSRGFRLFVLGSAFFLSLFLITADRSQAQDNAAAAEEEKPYKIDPDGTVDWPTFSGFRRFNSECFVCHGPDGVGSSFAPALVDSLKTMTYEQFLDTVTNGKQEVNTAVQKKMPAFGTNPNVMCYIEDIFVYLRARANDAIARGRPQKHEDKSEATTQAENSCLGHKG